MRLILMVSRSDADIECFMKQLIVQNHHENVAYLLKIYGVFGEYIIALWSTRSEKESCDEYSRDRASVARKLRGKKPLSTFVFGISRLIGGVRHADFLRSQAARRADRLRFFTRADS